MYSIIDELSDFTLHSSKFSAEVIHEEIEVMESNHDIKKIDVMLLDLTYITDTFSNTINKLILEFCFYIIYINDISDNEIIELFDEYILEHQGSNKTAIHNDMRFLIVKKIKTVKAFLNRHKNILLFVGWMEKINTKNYSAGFITGYDDGQM